MGVISYWSLGGENIAGAALRALFTKHGLDQEWYPPPFLSFGPGDIQRLLIRNIGQRMGSIALRRSGGIYFSPLQLLPLIDKHRGAIEEISSNTMGVIVVPNYERNQRAISRSTLQTLERDLSSIKDEQVQFAASPPREDTLRRRLEEYEQLRQRCDTYAAVLGITVGDLKQEIDACTQRVPQMLKRAQASKEQTKEDRKVARRLTAKQDRNARGKIRRVRKVRT